MTATGPTGLTMPPAVQPGDAIALVSPAGPAPPESIDAAVDLVRSWGVQPVLGSAARDRDPELSYLAGSDQRRATDLEQAWCDPDIRGVISLRGGYGTIRLLDRLDVDRWRAASPKRVFGSSDLTCLHEFLAERIGVGSWFTPMPATSIIDDDDAMAGLRAAMFADLGQWTIDTAGTEPLHPGRGIGRLCGGNLSLLAMTLGARDSVRREGRQRRGRVRPRVVVLEDVDEPLYKIDGFLQSLLRAGWFDDVVAVGLGTWLNCGDPGSDETPLRNLVGNLLSPLQIPILAGLRFGHGPAAQSLPFGAVVELAAEPGQCQLRLL